MTIRTPGLSGSTGISTPMPLAGHDAGAFRGVTGLVSISTPMPLAGHDDGHNFPNLPLMISTPMPLAGHDEGARTACITWRISTPMPLAGHDMDVLPSCCRISISTPMPLAGHDALDDVCDSYINVFLLPCPSRGMTPRYCILLVMLIFLLPCPSRGMTLVERINARQNAISTPMPLAGHDVHGVSVYRHQHDFYSHAPRGA